MEQAGTKPALPARPVEPVSTEQVHACLEQPDHCLSRGLPALPSQAGKSEAQTLFSASGPQEAAGLTAAAEPRAASKTLVHRLRLSEASQRPQGKQTGCEEQDQSQQPDKVHTSRHATHSGACQGSASQQQGTAKAAGSVAMDQNVQQWWRWEAVSDSTDLVDINSKQALILLRGMLKEAEYPLQRVVQQAAKTKELPGPTAAKHALKDSSTRRLQVCQIIRARRSKHREAAEATAFTEKALVAAEEAGFVVLKK